MSRLALAMSLDGNDAVERAKTERRHFQRVRLEITGRIFLPGDNVEANCQIANLSAGGAQVLCETVPAADTKIVLYIEGFGRFEGTVLRPGGGRFGVKFHCSEAKREKTTDLLMLFLNRTLVGDEAAIRRHDRTPAEGPGSFRRANGEAVACQVIDLSLSGVSLKTAARPPFGEIITIGHTSGRVVRHHESGIAIEFVKAKAAKAPANPFTIVR